jgi:hypothetical protein
MHCRSGYLIQHGALPFPHTSVSLKFRLRPPLCPCPQSTLLLTPVTAWLLSNCSNIFDVSVLTVFPSEIKFLKHGIVKPPKDKANASYTILLVGTSGSGKTSLWELIANVLLGNDIDHYHYDFWKESEDRSPHLYEITSVNGILVSARVCNKMRRNNRFVRFVSSTRLGWPAPTILSETRPAQRVL